MFPEEPDQSGSATMDTAEWSGRHDVAKGEFELIVDAADEAYSNQDTQPGDVVVGSKAYAAADAWVKHEHGENSTIEEAVAPVNLVVVSSGREVRPGRDPKQAVWDEVSDDDGDSA